MASVSIENGKKIEELLEIRTISSEAYFLVSETALARKISFRNIRNMLNGDNAVNDLNNLYYSVEKMNELLDGLRDEIKKCNDRIDQLNQGFNERFQQFDSELGNLRREIGRVEEESKSRDRVLQTNLNILEAKLTDMINQEIDDRLYGDQMLDDKFSSLIKIEEQERIADVNAEESARISADNHIHDMIKNFIGDTTEYNSLNGSTANYDTNYNCYRDTIKALQSRCTALEQKFGQIQGLQWGTTAPSNRGAGIIYFQYF